MPRVQCDFCGKWFQNTQGLRVHRTRSSCKPDWEKHVASITISTPSHPEIAVQYDEPEIDNQTLLDSSTSPQMDWEPMPAEEHGSPVYDATFLHSSPPHRMLQLDRESPAHHYREIDIRQPDGVEQGNVQAEMNDGSENESNDTPGDEDKKSDEEEDNNDREDREEGEDEGKEEDEDEGDEEYEDEESTPREALDASDVENDLDSLGDQSCPVDEGHEDNTFEEHYLGAGCVHKTRRPPFRGILNERLQRDENIYLPFEDQQEWELANWLHQSGLSMSKIDDFLKLQYVSVLLYCATDSITLF